VRGRLKSTNMGLFFAAFLAAFIALVALPSAARADSSAWTFAGAGAFAWKEGTAALAPQTAMTFDIGVGTNPDAKVIVGGLFRWTPVFSQGSDVGLLLRVATHGFQAGDFGVALDAGGFQRTWGSYARGVTGAFTIGFPLGFSMSFQGLYGTNGSLGLGAVAGIDFLRLTVYRQVLLKTWPNPYPAQEIPPTMAFGLSSPGRFF